MWLILNKGFLSIVRKENCIVVRARVKSHLENYFPEYTIEESSFSDYRYRIRISRKELELFLASLSDEVQYDNFKNSVTDSRLKEFCNRVWELGYQIFNFKFYDIH